MFFTLRLLNVVKKDKQVILHGDTNEKRNQFFLEIKDKDGWMLFFTEDIELLAAEASKCAESFYKKKLSGEDVIELICTLYSRRER